MTCQGMQAKFVTRKIKSYSIPLKKNPAKEDLEDK